MEYLIALSQLIFVLFMLGIMCLFLLVLLQTWSWAQQQEPEMSFADILSTTAIEWGALITLMFTHLKPPAIFNETPPIGREKHDAKQYPILFVPSLHTGRGVFSILCWRLKKHFYTSLWPFQWKPFLNSSALLEDQLLQFILEITRKTNSPILRVMSFGSSHPIVARVLDHPSLSHITKKWISVSGPRSMSQTMKFLSTRRIREVFAADFKFRSRANLLIHGSRDVFCWPESIFEAERMVSVHPVGHFSVLLHPTTVQRALDEFSNL